MFHAKTWRNKILKIQSPSTVSTVLLSNMIHMQLENINNPKKVYKCTWLLYTCSNSTYVKFVYRVKRECLYFYTAYMSNKFSNIAVDISLFTAIPSFVVFSFTKYSVQGKLQSCLLRPYLQLSIFTDLECLITIDSTITVYW